MPGGARPGPLGPLALPRVRHTGTARGPPRRRRRPADGVRRRRARPGPAPRRRLRPRAVVLARLYDRYRQEDRPGSRSPDAASEFGAVLEVPRPLLADPGPVGADAAELGADVCDGLMQHDSGQRARAMAAHRIATDLGLAPGGPLRTQPQGPASRRPRPAVDRRTASGRPVRAVDAGPRPGPASRTRPLRCRRGRPPCGACPRPGWWRRGRSVPRVPRVPGPRRGSPRSVRGCCG